MLMNADNLIFKKNDSNLYLIKNYDYLSGHLGFWRFKNIFRCQKLFKDNKFNVYWDYKT